MRVVKREFVPDYFDEFLWGKEGKKEAHLMMCFWQFASTILLRKKALIRATKKRKRVYCGIKCDAVLHPSYLMSTISLSCYLQTNEGFCM